LTTTVPPQPSIRATLLEAIRGSRQDYTEAPIGRAVILLAVPMVLEMLMESVFLLVDTFFVGKLGADAVAVVGITESLMVMIYAVAMGLAIGAAAVVARRIGEKDPDAAAHAAFQAIAFGVLFGVATGTIGAAFAPDLLRLMGASEAVVAGSGFARVMLGGSGIVLQLFLINAVFRGAGDAAIAMRVLWFANGINIILGPLLIFGVGPFPELGVLGAGIATTFGRGCGVVYQLYHLTRPSSRLRIRRAHVGGDLPVMRGILNIAGTAMFQNFINTASWAVLVRLMAGFGSAAVAGNTIGIRIILFALLPSFGVSSAAATLVGQNLGAGKPERSEEAAWTAGRYNTYCLTAIGLIFLLFAPMLTGVFTDDPDVAGHATHSLRIIAAGFLFYGYGMVMSMAFNGAGDTRTPTLINLACFWLWEIPLAWALAYPFGLGPSGVFIAVAVSFSTFAFVSMWLFSKGTWKTKRV
jgi:putative MATE family efflux protein